METALAFRIGRSPSPRPHNPVPRHSQGAGCSAAAGNTSLPMALPRCRSSESTGQRIGPKLNRVPAADDVPRSGALGSRPARLTLSDPMLRSLGLLLAVDVGNTNTVVGVYEG